MSSRARSNERRRGRAASEEIGRARESRAFTEKTNFATFPRGRFLVTAEAHLNVSAQLGCFPYRIAKCPLLRFAMVARQTKAPREPSRQGRVRASATRAGDTASRLEPPVRSARCACRWRLHIRIVFARCSIENVSRRVTRVRRITRALPRHD